MKKKMSWYADQLPFCCGVYEAGEFADEDPRGPPYLGWAKLDTIDEALQAMKSTCGGRPIIFNFVKQRIEKKWARRYEAAELRKLVLADPACVNIGTHINPGTGNRIHTLIL